MSKNNELSLEFEKYLSKKDELISFIDEVNWSLTEVEAIVFKTLLFVYDLASREVRREMDADPNFLNYREGRAGNYLESISFESSIKNKFEKLVVNTFFKGVTSEHNSKIYLARALYLFEKEFVCEIDVLTLDSEYQAYKKFWLD